jgi:hypothetical protein
LIALEWTLGDELLLVVVQAPDQRPEVARQTLQNKEQKESRCGDPRVVRWNGKGGKSHVLIMATQSG